MVLKGESESGVVQCGPITALCGALPGTWRIIRPGISVAVSFT
jgi:hypothetical protein